MRIASFRALGTIACLILTAIALMPANARATTYTYTETVSPSSETCGSPGDCFILLAVYSPFTGTTGPTLKAGDVVNMNVTFSTPFSVPGATGASAIFGALVDTNYYNCAGINLPACMTQSSDLANSTETIIGENSGGPAIVTGHNFANPGFYSAFAYANGANPGFSVTGFDATFTIANSDPFPITAVAVESEVLSTPFVTTTPEPSTTVLALCGIALLCAAGKFSRLGVA